MLQAIIDIGSNTVRMAIYQIHGDKAEFIMKKKSMLGLAAYVKNGIMERAGIDRVVEILLEFCALLTAFGIERCFSFTTAALRNAANSQEAVAAIEARTGIPLRVLTGEEEAELAFLGATHDLGAAAGLLIDIGGGSTELVHYEGQRILEKRSLPIGSLALRTRYVSGLLPTPAEAAAMTAAAEAALAGLGDFAAGAAHFCGIGGAFKGAHNLHRAMGGAGAAVPVLFLSDLIARFSPAGPPQEADGVLLLRTEPDRIHTIVPGLILARAIAERFAAQEILYSDSGVREGFLYHEIVRRPPGA